MQDFLLAVCILLYWYFREYFYCSLVLTVAVINCCHVAYGHFSTAVPWYGSVRVDCWREEPHDSSGKEQVGLVSVVENLFYVSFSKTTKQKRTWKEKVSFFSPRCFVGILLGQATLRHTIHKTGNAWRRHQMRWNLNFIHVWRQSATKVILLVAFLVENLKVMDDRFLNYFFLFTIFSPFI